MNNPLNIQTIYIFPMIWEPCIIIRHALKWQQIVQIFNDVINVTHLFFTIEQTYSEC